MLRSWLRPIARRLGRKLKSRHAAPPRFMPRAEPLGDRIVPAIVASVPSPGLLFVTGDAAANTIIVSRTAGGTILVNGATVPFGGGALTVFQTSLIEVFGGGGNDTLGMDIANGGLPKGILMGGGGNDTLIGSTGADQLLGGQGDDT